MENQCHQKYKMPAARPGQKKLANYVTKEKLNIISARNIVCVVKLLYLLYHLGPINFVHTHVQPNLTMLEEAQGLTNQN